MINIEIKLFFGGADGGVPAVFELKPNKPLTRKNISETLGLSGKGEDTIPNELETIRLGDGGDSVKLCFKESVFYRTGPVEGGVIGPGGVGGIARSVLWLRGVKRVFQLGGLPWDVNETIIQIRLVE